MVMLFNNLQGMTDLQKAALICRYISVMNELRRRTKSYAMIFHVGRMIVTIGSLLVPALLSIQYTNAGPAFTTEMSYQIYWITWAVSLLVTTFNGILTLFRVEKKYYFLHTTLEQIKSEAFQFIHLTGIYGGHYCKPNVLPTHANQYKFFVYHLEKIKLKQVEEEYYKLIEQSKPVGGGGVSSAGPTGAATADTHPAEKTIAGLLMSTPSQNEIISHQKVLAEAVIKPNIQIGVGLDNASNKAQESKRIQLAAAAGTAAGTATATAAATAAAATTTKQTQTKSQTIRWRPPSPTATLSV